MKKFLLTALMLVSFTASFAQPRVLYFCDGLAGTDHMATALTNMGCIVTPVTDHATFQTEISTPSNFDIAIHFIQSNWPEAASVTALVNFMAIPGKKGMYCDWSRDAGFGSQVGVGFTGSINETSVTITDPVLAAGLTTNPFTLANPGWGTFATGLTALPGGVVAGTFGSGQAALIKTMGDNMLVFGYTSDAVGSPEFYENAISYLSAANISTNPVSGPLCTGRDLNVTFTAGGTFTGTNVFTAELSDASGSFASPTVLGSFTGSTASPISTTVPAVTSGTGYRIRVTSTDPVTTGSDNGTDLVLGDTPTLTVSASPIVCNGGNSTVVVSATGGSGPYMGTGTFTVPAGTYNYYATDAIGCNSDTTAETITEPAAITHSQTINICNGQSVTIGSNVYTTAGTYTDVLVNGDGCDSTLTTTINVSSVNVSTSTVGITITAAATPATYQWLNCATMMPIGGATSQSYTPTANGQYAAQVTESGCTDTTACVTINSVGIALNGNAAEMSIYPNPANGSFTLNVPVSGTMTLMMVDIHGRQVMNVQEAVQAGQSKQVNIQGLAKGLYYVQVSMGQLNTTEKLVIE